MKPAMSMACSPITQPNTRCFACGPDNPHCLQLRFTRLQPGEVTTRWETCE
jgi:hypothetical protein